MKNNFMRHKKKRTFFLSLVLTIVISLFNFTEKATAQSFKLKNTPETFVEEIKNLTTSPKQEPSLFFIQFDSTWNQLSKKHQSVFHQAALQMGLKNYPLNSVIQAMEFVLLTHSDSTWTNASKDAFFEGLGRLVDKYDSKATQKAIDHLLQFTKTRLLFQSNFNKLYATSKTFTLEFEKNPKRYYTTQESQTVDLESLDLLDDGWDTPESNWKGRESLSKIDLRKKNIETPLISGWILHFPEANLSFVSKTDSIVVEQTTCSFVPTTSQVVGQAGKLRWTSAGFPTAVSSWKSAYFFFAYQTRLVVEDTELVFEDVLKKPILGVSEVRIIARNPQTVPSYPRFKSYDGNADIQFIENNIRYKGGISLVGPRIRSSSLYDGLTEIQLIKENKTVFKVKSKDFELTDSLITSPQVAFTGFIKTDSVFHPAVRFQYHQQNEQVQLNVPQNSGYRIAPFVDTFHKMYITSDAAKWDIKKESMNFYIVSGKDIKPTIFESFDFYSPQRIIDLSTLAGFNPLLVANNLVRKTRKNEFSIDDLASAIGKKREQITGGVSFATHQGLFLYDLEKENYKITPKGIHYLLSYAGQKDYDDLIIPSIYNGSDSTGHGIIDFKSAGLTINGTKEFRLSDSLGIILYPKNQAMEIKRSGTYTFDGQIRVKNYSFYGKKFKIDYDQFTVELQEIDSIIFTPKELYRQAKKVYVGGNIRYPSSGILYLNDPKNKSGKLYLPEYPKLSIPQGTTVYFDTRRPQNARFNQNVRFEIPRIQADSMHVKDLTWIGTFHSDGIFKPIQDTLRVMPDLSIGFRHNPPPNGLPIYGSNSTFVFYEPLQLDAKGLHAQGELVHLSGNYILNNADFKVDGLQSSGRTGIIKEANLQKTYFPEVLLKEFTLQWKPKTDSLLIATKTDLAFYQGSTTFSGQLIVRKSGMFGQGKLTRIDSEAKSQEIKFNEKGFLADKSQFLIKSSTSTDKPVLLGHAVDIDFDVSKQLVQIQGQSQNNFISSETSSRLEFPYSAYQTNIKRAVWNINEKKIALNGPVEETFFMATNPRKENLSFSGNQANYDLTKMELEIRGVPSIVTADVRIIPADNQVVIKKEADMATLKNATVLADTLNQYHTLTKANIDIFSKSKFTGDASYQFISSSLDTFNIKMGNFSQKELLLSTNGRSSASTPTGYTTIASATVRERDSLYLSPKMLYRGDIIMTANQQNLTFDGFVIPLLKKYPKLGRYWIKYAGNRSETVRINVDESLRTTESNLVVGLHFKSGASTNLLYPTFLQPKTVEDDHDLFTVQGILSRNEPEQTYDIETKQVDLFQNRVYQLHEEKGEISFEGRINLLSGLDKQYAESAAKGVYQLDSSSLQMNIFTSLLFALPPAAFDYMAKDIIAHNLELGSTESAIVPSDSSFLTLLSHLIGAKSTSEYATKSARQHVPLYKHLGRFAPTITLSDLTLKWMTKNNSFINQGLLGISNIGENDINAQVPGYFEVIKNPVIGDELYLFIELTPDKWYYLGYKDGEPGVVSSDNQFNQLIKARDKGSKKGQVIPVDMSEALVFRKRFQQTYLGIAPSVPQKKAPIKKKVPIAEKKDGF